MRCVVSAGNVTCNRCLRLGRSCEFRPESRTPFPPCHQRGRSSASHTSYATSSLRSPHTSHAYTGEVSSINDFAEGIPGFFYSTRSEHLYADHGPGNQPARPTAEPRNEQQDLLSIYSTSPVSAVVDNSAQYEPVMPVGQASSGKGDSRSRPSLPLARDIQSQDKNPARPPSSNEMNQLIHM